jgi:FtsZ-interacting cell division protein ZipA
MSTLQIGLAIAGGVVLVGVVAHSAWTSRKSKPRQARPAVADAPATETAPVEASSTPSSYEATASSYSAEPRIEPLHADTGRTEPALTADPLPRSDAKTDPVTDMALAMMQEATLHAQRVPDEAELARLQAQRAAQQAQAAQAVAAARESARAQSDASAIASRVLDDHTPELIQPEKRPSLDALIDVIAMLELEAPTSGEAALQVMPTTRRVGTKVFLIEGLNAETGQWETVRNGQRYSGFQTGVQLANRTGALNEIEFSEFVLKTQQFADAVGAAAEFPDMMEQVGRARELDTFASAHDAQLSFTLKATKAAWSPGYVQQNAARLGFVPGVLPGRLVVPAPAAGLPPILGLTFDSQAAMAEDPAQSAIYELTLSLDVPQVDRKEEPFARMVQTALELARVMDGAVTDDNGQPLSEAAITSIARALMSLYDTLDARDLSAGSPQARRLFS